MRTPDDNTFASEEKIDCTQIDQQDKGAEGGKPLLAHRVSTKPRLS